MDKYVAYGAGFYGKCALLELGFDSITAFCDTYINNRQYIYGKKILNIEDVKKTDCVLICVRDVKNKQEIINILEIHGLKYKIYNPIFSIVKIFEQDELIQQLLETNEYMKYLLELHVEGTVVQSENEMSNARKLYCKSVMSLEDAQEWT